MDRGLELMLVGMSTVFAFLGLLVLVMGLTGRFFAGRTDDEPVPAAASAIGTADDEALAVAVAAAVRHRMTTP